MKSNFYISTSIAYVNGTPHLGFALESVMSDAVARYQRMMGRDTFFLTGTDEHGIKVYKTAQEQGLTARELCDKNSAEFQKLRALLNLSTNDFIRTTDQKKHWPSVQKLWAKLQVNGDIEKRSYEGLYCEGCEVFLPEKDLVDGSCAIHKKPPVKVAEENYFFKLSKYSDQILKAIESKTLEIVPEFRQNEIVAVLRDGGLKDVSFSRPSDSLPWGIPVPGDASQNMYVWCDALSNYISALDYANEGELYQKYWANAERVHAIGKDIVRFHAGIWIGMLLSAGVPLPNKIFIHGFLTSEGQKMSKSLGNVVDPFVEVEKYGTDPLRYFLLSQVPVGQDYDFTRAQFENIYNAHLANNLGNLVNRVSVLCEKNGITPAMIQNSDVNSKIFASELTQKWQEIFLANNAFMKSFSLHLALGRIVELLDFLNKQMDEHKPWLLAKTDPEKLKDIMPLFLESMRQVSYMLDSFIPETAQKIRIILGAPETTLLDEKTTWNGQAHEWNQLGEKQILFPRLEK